jgi:hypothetical protein
MIEWDDFTTTSVMVQKSFTVLASETQDCINQPFSDEIELTNSGHLRPKVILTGNDYSCLVFMRKANGDEADLRRRSQNKSSYTELHCSY